LFALSFHAKRGNVEWNMNASSRKDLAVVIVSWNVRDILSENLKALFSEGMNTGFTVIVIDNASNDGTIEAVRAAFPQVRVIANKRNEGFAKACNQGIEEMVAEVGGIEGAPHILLLNPDMLVVPNMLAKTVAYLNVYPDVAVVGAKLLDKNEQPMHHMRRFPTLRDQLAILLKLPHIFPGLLRRYYAEDLDLEKEQEVDSVRGSYFAINKTALQRIGNLDERYFIWFEEVDYCRMAKEKGMKVMYVPSIVAEDLVGRSAALCTTFWKQKVFTHTMILYFKKWYSAWQAVLLQIIRPFALTSAWITDYFRRKPSRLKNEPL